MAIGRSPSPGALLEGVERVAVLRAGGLGDTIFLLPALDALRAAYPHAEVTLIGGRLQAELFRARPPVDHVLALPAIRGVTAPIDADIDEAAVDHAIADIVAERFDLAIQAHGGGRYSNALTRRFGAAFTLGCRTPDAAPLDLAMPHVYHAPEVERWIELMSLIGARAESHEPRLTLLASDRDDATPLLHVGRSGSPLVALHVGAGDPRRRWPPRSFARIADALADQGCCVVLVGTAADRASVDEVIAGIDPVARKRVIDACGSLSLGGLAAFLEHCDVFVGNDSGPLHLAASVGVRTVGIYWCPNMINAGPPGRRRHRPQIAWRLDCPVCRVNLVDSDCDHEDSVVGSVSEQDVLEATIDLLAGVAAGPPRDPAGQVGSPASRAIPPRVTS